MFPPCLLCRVLVSVVRGRALCKSRAVGESESLHYGFGGGSLKMAMDLFYVQCSALVTGSGPGLSWESASPDLA